MKHLTIALGLLTLLAPVIAHAQEAAYPPGSGVLNVQSYGATPNDTTDDTEAFRAAIRAALDTPGRYGAQTIIYIPNGTYRITDTLFNRDTNGRWRAGLWLQGQSRAGTILRVPDGTAGWGDPAAPKAVIFTGSENATSSGGTGNQAFRHYIRNLTINVGANNPGAVGIDYVVSNRGGIYDVSVLTADAARRGHTGIRMDRDWPGPALIRNVSVTGFDTGISMRRGYQYGMTFENITLSNQLVVGFHLTTNTAYIRKLTSTNSVPAVFVDHKQGHLNLIDSVLQGGSSANPAIRNEGKLHLRDIQSTGYGSVVQDLTGENRPLAAGPGTTTVAEYFSHGPHKSFADSIDATVRLPVEETPDFHTLDFSRWAVVTDFGATPGGSETDNDDAIGIQAAIDSGKEIVFLPRGSYAISQPIIIRGNVRKILGGCAAITARNDFPVGSPVFRFDSCGGDFVVLTGIRATDNAPHAGIVEHNSAKTLVLRQFESGPYRNTPQGTGKLFMEDVKIQDDMNTDLDRVKIDHGQRAWIRQLNIEFAQPPTSFLNVTGGAKAWVFGYKIERTNSCPALTVTGAQTWAELIGNYWYFVGNQGPVNDPYVVAQNANFSLSYKLGGATPAVHVRETRGATTLDFPTAANPAPGANNVPLYSGATALFAEELWTAQDIGTTGLPGSSSASGGTFTVQGAGAGYGTGFHFLHRRMEGNGEIIARVASLTGGSAARAGLMLRTSLAVDAPFTSIAMSPTRVFNAHRTTTGGTVASGNTAATMPRWLRIVRSGSNFTVFHSADGVSWTSRGTVTLSGAGSQVFVGLAVCSGSTTSTSTAVIDSVTAP